MLLNYMGLNINLKGNTSPAEYSLLRGHIWLKGSQLVVKVSEKRYCDISEKYITRFK